MYLATCHFSTVCTKLLVVFQRSSIHVINSILFDLVLHFLLMGVARFPTQSDGLIGVQYYVLSYAVVHMYMKKRVRLSNVYIFCKQHVVSEF